MKNETYNSELTTAIQDLLKRRISRRGFLKVTGYSVGAAALAACSAEVAKTPTATVPTAAATSTEVYATPVTHVTANPDIGLSAIVKQIEVAQGGTLSKAETLLPAGQDIMSVPAVYDLAGKLDVPDTVKAVALANANQNTEQTGKGLIPPNSINTLYTVDQLTDAQLSQALRDFPPGDSLDRIDRVRKFYTKADGSGPADPEDLIFAGTKEANQFYWLRAVVAPESAGGQDVIQHVWTKQTTAGGEFDMYWNKATGKWDAFPEGQGVKATATPTSEPTKAPTEAAPDESHGYTLEQIKDLGSDKRVDAYTRYYRDNPDYAKPQSDQELLAAGVPQSLIDELDKANVKVADTSQALRNGELKGREAQGLYLIGKNYIATKTIGGPGSLGAKDYGVRTADGKDRPFFTMAEIVDFVKVGTPGNESYYLLTKDSTTGETRAFWYVMQSMEYGCSTTSVEGLPEDDPTSRDTNFLVEGAGRYKDFHTRYDVGPEVAKNILRPGRVVLVITDVTEKTPVKHPYSQVERAASITVYDTQENIQAQTFATLHPDNTREYYPIDLQK